jgi:hypothetical protein
MILDAFLLFTGGSGGVGNNDGRTDSPTTGSQVSSNSLDLAQGQTNLAGGLPPSQSTPFAAPGRDLGIGDDPAMKLLVQVSTALTGGTNIAVNFQGAPDSGTGTAGAFVVYATGPTVVEANLIVGARLLEIDWPRPAPGSVPPRFVQLGYVSSGTHGAGKLLGTAVLDRFDQPLDANAVTGAYLPGIVIAN